MLQEGDAASTELGLKTAVRGARGQVRNGGAGECKAAFRNGGAGSVTLGLETAPLGQNVWFQASGATSATIGSKSRRGEHDVGFQHGDRGQN